MDDLPGMLAGLSPAEIVAFRLEPEKLLILAQKHTNLFKPKERALALLYTQKYVSFSFNREYKNIESLA